jgi:Zn-dependent peptidase ImmA (M78 family)
MIDYQTRRKLVLKATAQAEKVRIKCKVGRTAPSDPIAISEQRGCDVRFMPLPSLEGIYAPDEPRATIILGSERSAGRRNFTCAHELGHHEFKHGMHVEELNMGRQKPSESEDEFLADMFAGSLLMPKAAVFRELKNRCIDPNKIVPIQAFELSSFFGVGYSSLIEHMTWTLSLLNSQQRKDLLKVAPKSFKSIFGSEAAFGLVIVNEHWKDRAIDLDIGDTLVLPSGAAVEDNAYMKHQGFVDEKSVFKALKRGYSRTYTEHNDWAANIRIAPKNYEGLARHRFLDDPEENIT